MKKGEQTLRVLLFISIYCFGIGVSALTATNSNTQVFVQNNGQEDSFSTASKTHFIHTDQSEISVSNFLESSVSNDDLSLDDFIIVLFLNKLLFNAKFKQYENHFKNLLIRHRKSDLIFPFHNFW
ncbi:hypothetical protein HSX10_10375 [Winogradskyella undariae]|uniref:hypothetical protein n=1 Tax=Winogradskyella undariae TaxID=1285465 RepID=UPI00156B0168|nr:hypothetical protein [Winogradskyella undariae]NRR91970.1 hypothetical protein [Winogradskyella undariae]QNK78794.1 hypothetical protein H7F37_06925 [Winogradskyella sp. PAMC22761]